MQVDLRREFMGKSKKIWMLRYSEVSLKSLPVRRQWEKAIITAVKAVLPDSDLWIERGRIWADGKIEPEKLGRIFGVVNYENIASYSFFFTYVWGSSYFYSKYFK